MARWRERERHVWRRSAHRWACSHVRWERWRSTARERRHTGHTVRREGRHPVWREGRHIWSCERSARFLKYCASQLTTASTHEWWWHSRHSCFLSASSPTTSALRLTSRHRHWWAPREASGHRSSGIPSAQVRRIQRICLTLRTVRIRDAVDDLLCLLGGDLLVVRLHVAQVVAAAVVRLAHAHTVVRKVHIAVVAEELRHRGDGVDRGGCGDAS